MIINDDILNWCKEYKGEKFHALLCDPPYHLTMPDSYGHSQFNMESMNKANKAEESLFGTK